MEARSFGCNQKDWKEHASEIDLLLDSTLTVLQARAIAQTLQNTELLRLLDLTTAQIHESINRRMYLSYKIDDSRGLN